MRLLRLGQGKHMLSNKMRSVARDVGLTIAPYQSELGFTAVREHDGRHLVFVLNTGEWMIYQAADVVLRASGSGPESFVAALREYFTVPAEIVPDAAASKPAKPARAREGERRPTSRPDPLSKAPASPSSRCGMSGIASLD